MIPHFPPSLHPSFPGFTAVMGSPSTAIRLMALQFLCLAGLFFPSSQGLGTNYASYINNVTTSSIPYTTTVSSSISVTSPPASTLGSTVLLVIVPTLTHSNPGDITVQVCDPSNNCAYLGYFNGYLCTSFFSGTTFYDGQGSTNYAWDDETCPPGSLVAFGEASTQGTPFSDIYRSDPLSGTWLLHILNSDGKYDTGYLYSWEIRLYGQ